MDQVNTAAWIGRSVCDQGGVDALSAAKLHATIGHAQTPQPPPGDLLPALWHWAAFPPLTHVTRLGADGHPGPGELMPPLRLPRRMWAGGTLRFHAPLRVGDMLSRQVSLRLVVEKETASGPMALVTLDHTITGPRHRGTAGHRLPANARHVHTPQETSPYLKVFRCGPECNFAFGLGRRPALTNLGRREPRGSGIKLWGKSACG